MFDSNDIYRNGLVMTNFMFDSNDIYRNETI